MSPDTGPNNVPFVAEGYAGKTLGLKSAESAEI
jgi:hypothetical protein